MNIDDPNWENDKRQAEYEDESNHPDNKVLKTMEIMNSKIRSKAIKSYLKEINALSKHCEVTERFPDSNERSEIDSVHFDVQVKEDPFADYSHITVSQFFEKSNSELFRKYFGDDPHYNNNYTIFWLYEPKYPEVK